MSKIEHIREIEETTRYLRDLIVVAKDAIKSAERAIERIEEELRLYRTAK